MFPSSRSDYKGDQHMSRDERKKKKRKNVILSAPRERKSINVPVCNTEEKGKILDGLFSMKW